MIDYAIIRIFPTCVMKLSLGRDFTSQEKDAFDSVKDIVRNQGNRGSKDKFLFNDHRFNDISEFCLKASNAYLKDVVRPDNDVSLYITQSWLNKTTKGEYHHTHFHQNSVLSGVLYVNAEREKDRIYFIDPRHSDSIQFSISDYTLENSNIWYLEVNTGDLIIFPSSLSHYVEPVSGDHERISVSFNTFIKGTVGRYENSNLLTL